MAKYTGKDMVVRFGTVSVAGQGRQLEIAQQGDDIDVTTYGSTDKEYITGFTERTATLEILDDSATSTIRNKFQVGTSDSLTWFPTGTGGAKFAVGTAIVTESNVSYPYDDAVLYSVTLRLNGAVTET